jgi:hypothetical protein
LSAIVEDLKTAGAEAQAGAFNCLRGRLQEQREAARSLYETVRGLTDMPAGALAAARAVLPEIEETVGRTRLRLAALPDAARARLARYLDAIESAAKSAQQSEPQSAISDLDRLAVGYGTMTEPLLSAVRRELAAEAGLAEAFGDQERRLREAVSRIPRPEVERRALRDLAYTGRTLDVVFRELNLFSAGPVVLFDAARIGSWRGGNPAGFRFGIGGGIRLSIVSLDLTLGYSRNPNPKPWEPKGALFFSLDVADLFR